jgi:hypothetical protein
MAAPKRFGDLQIHYDLAHEEREWLVHRFSWALMSAFCTAAVLGLFGNGWLSRRNAETSGSSLHLEYEKFVRYRASSELKAFVKSGEERFTLSFDRAYLTGQKIEEIKPAPIETSAHGREYVFTFKSTKDQQLIVFRLESGVYGRTSTRVTLDGKESLHIEQFSWP